eukprot:m.126628 g.126628  ORF g.126628 m.126628 type:complete len:80 (-) comp29215_c0_seq1:2238-2477(-)
MRAHTQQQWHRYLYDMVKLSKNATLNPEIIATIPVADVVPSTSWTLKERWSTPSMIGVMISPTALIPTRTYEVVGSVAT